VRAISIALFLWGFMNIRDVIVDLRKTRSEIKAAEDQIYEIQDKLTERKKILSEDKEFNELNLAYKALQEKHSQLIDKFATDNDNLISKYGELND
jgi:hypothetical protein